MPSTPRRRGAAAIALRAIVTLGIAIGVVVGVWLDRHQIVAGLPRMAHLHRSWMIAVILETGSVVAAAMLQRILLRACGQPARLLWLMATVYGANAISSFVPFAGSSISVSYTARRWRARGVDLLLAGSVLALGGAVSLLCLAFLAIAGAILSGQPTAALASALSAVLLIVIGSWLSVSLRTRSGRDRIARCMIAALAWTRRVSARPRRSPAELVSELRKRMSAFHFSNTTLPLAAAASLMSWAANVGVLAAALTAVGAPVPWQHLLLVWSAGQAAATLTPVPGGIGVVEATLVSTLIAAGVTNAHAVVAVLLYRLVSFQLLRTIVWLLGAAIVPRRGCRVLPRHRPG